MDACLHILLPYGLSSQYQDILKGRNITPVLYGLPRFRTASLLELSKLNSPPPNQSLPALGSIPQSHQVTRKRKPSYAHRTEENMGFQRNIRNINMGPATAKEKRGRAKRKPQISVHKVPKAGPKISPSTRVGASQQLPITLDSDDDVPTSSSQRPVRGRTRVSLVEPNLRNFRYEPHKASGRQDVNQSPGTLRKQSYTPKGFVLRHSRPTSTEPTGNRKYVRIPGETVGRDHDSEEEESPIRRPAIGRKRLPYSNVPASSDGNLVEQDTSIPLSNSIAVPHERATSSRRSRISEQATCIRPHTPGLPADWSHSLDKRRKESRPGAINMNLLDIDDFSMRSKVAQLMAVAPALPIVDLYHLIIDSEGNLPLAKKQAIRMSEAPQAQYRPDLDADGDEVMVKIDPNDPAFEWDDDEPAPEWATTIAPRQSRIKAKPNYKATKAKSLRNNSKSTRSAKSATKYCSNTSAKRTQSTSMNPTHARETSSDRDFVVPDNTIHYDLGSDLSNDSDQSQDTIARSIRTDSHFEMLDGDDPLDLDIDMQPRFAYNARLLRDGARS